MEANVRRRTARCMVVPQTAKTIYSRCYNQCVDLAVTLRQHRHHHRHEARLPFVVINITRARVRRVVRSFSCPFSCGRRYLLLVSCICVRDEDRRGRKIGALALTTQPISIYVECVCILEFFFLCCAVRTTDVTFHTHFFFSYPQFYLLRALHNPVFGSMDRHLWLCQTVPDSFSSLIAKTRRRWHVFSRPLRRLCPLPIIPSSAYEHLFDQRVITSSKPVFADRREKSHARANDPTASECVREGQRNKKPRTNKFAIRTSIVVMRMPWTLIYA